MGGQDDSAVDDGLSAAVVDHMELEMLATSQGRSKQLTNYVLVAMGSRFGNNRGVLSLGRHRYSQSVARELGETILRFIVVTTGTSVALDVDGRGPEACLAIFGGIRCLSAKLYTCIYLLSCGDIPSWRAY